MPEEINPKLDKIVSYNYSSYKNLIKIALFLNAAGITAVIATLGLRYKPSSEKVSHFVNIEIPFDVALNPSLESFLLSLLMIIICAITDYLSYWPRRKKEELHAINNSNCCRCNFIISTCVFIMFATLFLSFLFLLYGGVKFKNIPLP